MAVLVGSGWYAAGQSPVILPTHIGAEETLPFFDGARASIATDGLDQPHAAVDEGPRNGGFWGFFDKVAGQWQLRTFLINDYLGGSNEFGSPRMVIDDGVAWITGVLANLGSGSGWGIGLINMHSVMSAPSPFIFTHHPYTGIALGNVEVDASDFQQGVILVTPPPGLWEKYQFNGNGVTVIGSGQMSAGNGGEKISFRMSQVPGIANVWHHLTDWSYQNSVRSRNGQDVLTWCSYSAYPSIGDDGAYPGLAADMVDPHSAYLTHSIEGGIFLNIWRGNADGTGAFARGANNLMRVDPLGSAGGRRFAPKMASAKGGGAWVAWTSGNRVKVRYIPRNASNEADLGPTVDICVGAVPAIDTDSKGNLHIIYNNGGMKYRKVALYPESSAFSGPGDFNGDNASDLSVFDPSVSEWWMLTLGGTALNPWPNGILWGFPGGVPVAGDFNGDNTDDLGVYNPTAAEWWLYSMDGVVLSPWPDPIQWGFPGATPVIGDFDGDNVDDLGIYDGTSAEWWIYSMDGRVLTPWPDPIQWGFPGAIPVAGDFNSDGKDDIGVYDSTTARWWLLSLDGVVISPWPNAIQWGFPGATPVVGDFNADGTDDIGVYDSAVSEWWLYSLDGTILSPWPLPFNWGYPGAQAVVGDFDGDDADDMGIYDTATSTWWVLSVDGRVLTPWPVPLQWGFPGSIPVGGR